MKEQVLVRGMFLEYCLENNFKHEFHEFYEISQIKKYL